MISKQGNLTVAIGGLGSIGRKVADALNIGIPGLVLTAVSARDQKRASNYVANFNLVPKVVPLEKLSDFADIVVECAPIKVFDNIALPASRNGRILVVMSAAALLFRPKLLSKIEETGGRIIVPTGALIGLDAVKAAAEGTIHQVKMVSTKPIKSLLAAPFLKEKNLILEDMVTPTKIFSGNALEAAIGFPENTNITAALSLAGIGPEKTLLEIWADPKTDRNIHTVELKGTETSFSVTIEGIPSSTNAASGLLTPLSLISTLRDLTSPLKVGS